jgi:hypothetical protein
MEEPKSHLLPRGRDKVLSIGYPALYSAKFRDELIERSLIFVSAFEKFPLKIQKLSIENLNSF